MWIASGALAGLAGPVHAETLRAALDAALRDSPSVRVAQARLAEARAAVQIEAAAGRPTLDLQVGPGPIVYGGGGGDGVATVGIDGSVLLYDGGRVRAMVAAARERVAAAQVEVDQAEGDLLTAVATAFMDVLRDAAVLDFDRDTIDRLEEQRLAAVKLQRGGEASSTDVHQSEARLAGARMRYWSDRGQLARSQAEFERLTGHAPGRLEAPDTVPPLAGDTALVGVAQEASPAVVAARARAAAARFEIRAAVAERRPTLSLTVKATGGLDMGVDPDLLDFRQRVQPTASTYFGVSLRLPLFGRLAGATVRRSRATSEAADADVAVAQRQAVADARTNQGRMSASIADRAASEAAVEANRAALVGVRKERTIGQRTVLDVLNAEQEFRDTEVRVVAARSETFITAARTLNAAGQARRLLDVDVPTGMAPAVAQKMLASSFDLGRLPNSRRAKPDGTTPSLPYAPTVMAAAPRLPYRSV